MSGTGKVPQAAYFYEIDDTGKRVHGSKQSARKEQERERPKISQTDSVTGEPRKSRSDTGKYGTSGTKAIEVVKLTEKEGTLARRNSTAGTSKSPRKAQRPPSAYDERPPKSSNSKSKKDDPSHFGISNSSSRAAPPVVSQPSMHPPRPRPVTSHSGPSRPQSFHAAVPGGGYATGPPPSNSHWFHQQYTVPQASFPPQQAPSYFQYPRNSQTGAEYFQPPPPINTAPVATRDLRERFGPLEKTTFDPIPRTASAFGRLDNPRDYPLQVTENSYYDDDGYTSASDGRRLSNSRPSIRGNQELDYDAMPPPPRPTTGILRNSSSRPLTVYDDSSAPSSRRESRESRDRRSLYRDESPARRPSYRRASVTYAQPGHVRVIESANASRRRSSYYGTSTESTESSDYVDDKVRQAQQYQEELSGPSPVRLTADLLKRQSRQRRQDGSSRSTKSSGSKDESDYRKSVTTRTTRSGSDETGENVTIKVTGSARIVVDGTQIECADGGQIEIQQQKSLRNGSERGSEWGGTQRESQRGRIEDQRRSRIEKLPDRTRMSSKNNQAYRSATEQWI